MRVAGVVLALAACDRSPTGAPPPPPPAVAPAPAPAAPKTCAADADCSFTASARCAVGPAGKQPEHGRCVCLDGGCALRPDGEQLSAKPCRWEVDNCELDVPSGRCEPDITASDSPRKGAYGPSCACGRKDSRCHLRWFEPIPCQTVDDCWSTDEPVAHPIPRPKQLRGREFRGCKDGENPPACVAGRCTIEGLTC